MLVDTAQQRGVVVVHWEPAKAVETARQGLRAVEAGGGDGASGDAGGGRGGDAEGLEERAHPTYFFDFRIR